MRQRLSKSQKIIIIILGVTLVTQIFFVAPFLTANTQGAPSSDDAKAAAEISNLTGVKAEEVIRIKQAVGSWNAALEVLKSRHPGGIEAQKEQRSMLLAQAGTGEELVQQLTAQGYTRDEIMQAKLLAERVQSQLQELTDSKRQPLVEQPSMELLSGKKGKDREEAYRKLAESFQAQKAIAFMLQLKKEFGSLEAVLDEYLLSLQAELDLGQYVNDKEAYLKAKNNAMAGLTPDRIVTLSVMEQDLLEKIKTDNHKSVKEDPLNTDLSSVRNQESKEKLSPLPEVPSPAVKDVKPMNPADQIRNELNAINPNKPF
ncbi:hypothetical protein PAESOLCIP111_04753 [Paenibacillus solanacearum]|uniref:Uncharacterized protein n=1 Tax=Paenibacillus solanacearum TaxID=2048548 RepID=A0A916NR40_9BACL|nr:hypothetical protein [Paenibacillus solanacearum]CAG7644635.1 hypothetical protein PAESOLCIP111_04753 [Paenibacillus solanacearum]